MQSSASSEHFAALGDQANIARGNRNHPAEAAGTVCLEIGMFHETLFTLEMFQESVLPTKSVSLRDVSKLAGVSPATVSRILNGHGNVAEETRARTLRAISQLGYEPKLRLSRFFKELHKGTQTVGYLAGSSMRNAMLASDGFYSRFLMSVSSELTANQFHLLFADVLSDLSPDGQLRCVAEGKVDGLILEAFQPDLSRILERAEITIPTVFLNVEMSYPKSDVVIPATERAAAEQVTYLYERGHRQIACFRARPAQTWQDRRFWRGFEEVCSSLNIGECMDLPVPLPFSRNSHSGAIREFLDRLQRLPIMPTAILTYDSYAKDFFAACGERGLRIPEDISLIGHDDRSGYQVGLPIGLTSFRLDMESMGAAAVRLLIERIKAPSISPRLLQISGKMVERASVSSVLR